MVLFIAQIVGKLGMALSQHIMSFQLLDGLVMFNGKKWLMLCAPQGTPLTNQMNPRYDMLNLLLWENSWKVCVFLRQRKKRM